MHGIDLHTPLTDQQLDAAIDSMARKIVDRRLETAAVLFLEMHKPLSFIASQAALVALPMLGPLVGAQAMADFSKILRKRENIDLLITRIEDMSASREELVLGASSRNTGIEKTEDQTDAGVTGCQE